MVFLFLGGTRSGKSELAERRAAGLPGPITYVATGAASDPSMGARIDAHRARRPSSWATAEVGAQLAPALASIEGTVLVDSLGTWVAGHWDFAVDAAGLCGAIAGRRGDTVIVSDEVGMGVHPATEVGMRFRDVLGEVNRAVAEVADEVVLVVAGRVLRLERAT
jgi:adenosyl cobinamide kinase/adenosyl cobinamide phosphate guanylyltransferase